MLYFICLNQTRTDIFAETCFHSCGSFSFCTFMRRRRCFCYLIPSTVSFLLESLYGLLARVCFSCYAGADLNSFKTLACTQYEQINEGKTMKHRETVAFIHTALEVAQLDKWIIGSAPGCVVSLLIPLLVIDLMQKVYYVSVCLSHSCD